MPVTPLIDGIPDVMINLGTCGGVDKDIKRLDLNFVEQDVPVICDSTVWDGSASLQEKPGDVIPQYLG